MNKLYLFETSLFAFIDFNLKHFEFCWGFSRGKDDEMPILVNLLSLFRTFEYSCVSKIHISAYETFIYRYILYYISYLFANSIKNITLKIYFLNLTISNL